MLCPRPETEQLVTLCMDVINAGGEDIPNPRILDVGCGTGAIGLALLDLLPYAECDVILGLDLHPPKKTKKKKKSQQKTASLCRSPTLKLLCATLVDGSSSCTLHADWCLQWVPCPNHLVLFFTGHRHRGGLRRARNEQRRAQPPSDEVSLRLPLIPPQAPLIHRLNPCSLAHSLPISMSMSPSPRPIWTAHVRAGIVRVLLRCCGLRAGLRHQCALFGVTDLLSDCTVTVL